MKLRNATSAALALFLLTTMSLVFGQACSEPSKAAENNATTSAEEAEEGNSQSSPSVKTAPQTNTPADFPKGDASEEEAAQDQNETPADSTSEVANPSNSEDSGEQGDTGDSASVDKSAEEQNQKPSKPMTEEDLLNSSLGDDIVSSSDIPYCEGKGVHERHKLDIHMPKDAKNLPVVVFFHGGAWTMRDKRDGKAMARGLCPHGYGVVSVGYRLVKVGDESSKFPQFVEDGAEAFAWIHKNIGEYGGDPEKLFISGHSAGAHIASLLATNSAFLEAHDLHNHSAIKGLISLSGVYDIPTQEENPMVAGYMNTVFAVDAETRTKASPQDHVDCDDPPAIILYAETELFSLDFQANALQNTYVSEKGTSELHCIEKRDHASLLREFGTEDDPAAKLVLEFLETTLKADGKAKESDTNGDEEAKPSETPVEK